MKNHTLIIIVLFSILYFCNIPSAKSSSNNHQSFINKVILYNNIHRHEKLYIHTDKPVYFTSENIWFSAYLTNARNNILNSTEKVLYVELVKPNGNIATKQIFKLTNGRCAGSLELSPNLLSGQYLIISYTNWMRNAGSDFYFTKKITIINENNNSEKINPLTNKTSLDFNPTISDSISKNHKTKSHLSIKFYPEGGHLIDQLNTKVAFEAKKGNHPASITGTLFNGQNEMVAVANTLWNGKGYFSFTPKYKTNYYITVNNTDTFYLPKVELKGYQLSVETPYNSDKIYVKIQHNNSENSTVFLLAMQDQKPVYALSDTLKDNVKIFEIKKSEFKSGIVQFTLFDNNKIPRNERLVFINHNDFINIELTPDNTAPDYKEKVNMSLRATDQEGNPVSGSFSLSITDANRVGDHHYPPLDFVNHQLIKSNLPELNVDASFFMQKSRKSEIQTNLVMMTNGWRRYNWNVVLQDTLPLPKYLEDPGLYMQGRLFRRVNLNPVPSGMNVTMIMKGRFDIFTSETNENGEFTFLLDDFEGEKNAVIQTKNRLDHKADFMIDLKSNLKSNAIDEGYRKRLIELELKTNEKYKFQGETISNISDLKKDQLTTELVRKLNQNFYLDTTDINIEEVTVLGKKVKNIKEVMISAYGAPSKTLGKKQIKDLSEERSWNNGIISVIQDAIPGLEIYSALDFIHFRTTDRRKHRFFIYVDGEMVGATDDDGRLARMHRLYTLDDLISLDAEIVESIDLVYPPKGKTNFDLSFEAAKNMTFDELSNYSNTSNDNASLSANNQSADPSSIMEEIGVDIREEYSNSFFYTSPEAIISIYTKNGQGLYSRTHFKGILNIKITGYSKTKKFYLPDYDDNDVKINNDKRTTLYWNPIVSTDSTGFANLEFFNSEVGHLFRAEAIGISIDGKPGNTRITFGIDSVEKINKDLSNNTYDLNEPESLKEIWQDDTKLKIHLLLEDQSPAGYSDISVPTKKWGNISNENGDFYLDKNIVNDDDTIFISYQGKESLMIRLDEISTNNNTLVLQPSFIKNSELNGSSIFKSAYKKIYKTKSRKTEYTNSAYRELIFSNQELHRLIDINTIMQIPAYRDLSVSFAPNPIEGRIYKVENYDSKAFYSPLNNSPYQIHVLDPFYQEVTFLNRSYFKSYQYIYKGKCQYQGREMYVIEFSQKDHDNYALSSGFALIDSENYGIAYLNWQVNQKAFKYINPDSYLMGGTTFTDFKLLYENNQAFYKFEDGFWKFKGGIQDVRFNLNNEINRYKREFLTTDYLKSKPDHFKPTLIDDLKTRFILVKHPDYRVEYWREPWYLPSNEIIKENITFMNENLILYPPNKD